MPVGGCTYEVSQFPLYFGGSGVGGCVHVEEISVLLLENNLSFDCALVSSEESIPRSLLCVKIQGTEDVENHEGQPRQKARDGERTRLNRGNSFKGRAQGYTGSMFAKGDSGWRPP